MWRNIWILGIVMTAGCLSPIRTTATAELASRDEVSRNSSQVEISGGRDVMNISPTLAMSGGGGILMGVILVGAAIVGWIRSKRTLRTMISAIEQMENGKEVKEQIAKAALSAGVADYLHKKVRKTTNDTNKHE
jgi:hypothetical protein